MLQAIQLEKEIEAKLCDFMSKMEYKLKISEGNVYKNSWIGGELQWKIKKTMQHEMMDDEINSVKTEVDKQLTITCSEMQDLSSK